MMTDAVGLADPGGVDQVLLHVRGPRVERHGAADGQGEHHEQLDRVLAQQAQTGPCGPSGRIRGLPLGHFLGLEVASDSSMVRRRYSTTSDAAAPMKNGTRQPQAYICSLGQRLLQHDQHDQCEQLAQDDARRTGSWRRNRAGPGWPPRTGRWRWSRTRHRPTVPAAAAPSPAGWARRCRSSRRPGRSAMSNDPTPISDHREGQRVAAAVAVGVEAQQPAAERAHQEADREDDGGGQQLRGQVRPRGRRPWRSRC